MKVLHINCIYAKSALHRLLVHHLDPAGEHAVILPSDGSTPFTPEEREKEAVCFRKYDRYLYFKKQHQIQRAVEENYDVSSFDCLHAYTLFTDGNTAMRLSKKYGKPYVVAVRSTDMNGFFRMRKLLRPVGIRVLENADAVIFLSEEYRRRIAKYLPRKTYETVLAKSRVIPNGIDPMWLRDTPPERTEEDFARIESGRLNIIFCGRIFDRKNPVRTGMAVDELIARGYDAHFTAVGPVQDERVLEELRRGKNFTYLPARPKEEILSLYRQHDLCVMCSYDETFGLVYAEAISQGLPVVYSAGEGFVGQFEEGEVGYAAQPDSTDDVVEKILAIVRDYRAISARCAERAKKFDWVRIAAQYNALYEEIVSR